MSRASQNSTIPTLVASGSSTDDLLDALGRDLRVLAQIVNPHSRITIIPQSDVSDQSDFEFDDEVPVPVEENSERRGGPKKVHRRVYELQSLDLVDLQSVFRSRTCLMQFLQFSWKERINLRSASH